MSPHTHRAGQGSNGKKNSVWSVKYKREQYGRRSRTDLEVWHHDGMPISLDKIARSEPFAGGPYKADISAYSCRMWNELLNRLIHNLSCSLSHVKEAGEESGWWNEASWCRSMHLWPCTRTSSCTQNYRLLWGAWVGGQPALLHQVSCRWQLHVLFWFLNIAQCFLHLHYDSNCTNLSSSPPFSFTQVSAQYGLVKFQKTRTLLLLYDYQAKPA